MYHVAGAFARNPAVLAYDILNEPSGLQSQVQRLWEDAARAIRRLDPDTMLFLTPQFLLGAVCHPANLGHHLQSEGLNPVKCCFPAMLGQQI